MQGIFNSTIDVLGKSIDMRAKSQNLISSNIANAETPNYTPKALSFESELQGALKGNAKNAQSTTNSRHIPLKGASSRIQSVAGHVVETPSKSPGKDGNSVEIENEMSRLVENQIMYNASVQMISKKFEGIKAALKVGG